MKTDKKRVSAQTRVERAKELALQVTLAIRKSKKLIEQSKQLVKACKHR